MPRPLLVVTALALFTACWFSVGFHQGDEHFQLLEFASWKLGLLPQEQLTWEFFEQMRPATQPALVYVLHKAAGLFGAVNPFYFAFFLRLLSAGLFLIVALKVWDRFGPALANEKLARWLALGLLFNWCAVYSGIRFTGEHWAGMMFALGLLIYPLQRPNKESNVFTPAKKGLDFHCLLAGFLFGLSFLFRYQVALMTVGFLAWLLFISKERWRRFGLVLFGGIIAVVLGTMIDRWFYGEWVLAPWNYLRSNLIEGKAATFGVSPWWNYFRLVFERGVPPLSLVFIAAPLWFAWRFRRDPLTWTMLPFLFVHFYLSRKDARFLFPLLPWVPVMVLAGIQALQRHWERQGTWLNRGVKILWTINLLILLTVLFRPARIEVAPAQFIYDQYEGPVTLFADDKHVFSYFNLQVHYYRRPGQVLIIETGTRADWPTCNTSACLYSQHTRRPSPPPGAKLVYTTRPEWPDRLGLREWVDTMKWWSIYELKETKY